jgi:ubiquinone/menaquinone biosynthesis C-methylase UbiE
LFDAFDTQQTVISFNMMNEPILEPILRWMRLRRVIPYIEKSFNVLDIGCGRSATFLRSIAPQISQGVGIDYKVNENIEIANIKVQKQILDKNLPFADNSFDVVTMLAVLEHIENEQEILSEVHRVLVPNGKLILTVPSIWAQPVLEFLAYKLKLVSKDEIQDHKRYYTHDKLKEVLVVNTGFQKFTHRYFQCWMNNFCVVVK